MKHRVFIVLILLLGFTALLTATEGTADNPVEFRLEGRNFSFSISEIRVQQGDHVRIVFANLQGTHDFVLDEFNLNSGVIRAGNEVTLEFVADRTGSFEYYCSVGAHRSAGMWGTLIVE